MLVKNLEDLLLTITGGVHSPLRRQKLLSLSPVYYFQGRNKESVLIVAGIHGSEPSGIDIANWLRSKLDQQTSQGHRPFYTTFIIPEILKLQAQKGRKKNTLDVPPGSESNEGRDVTGNGKQEFNPSRSFPLPGQPTSHLLKNGSLTKGYFTLNDKGERIQPIPDEMVALMLIIEAVKPKRVASLHGKRLKNPDEYPVKNLIESGQSISRDVDKGILGINFPGIYVDPRYSFSLEKERKDPNLDSQKFIAGLDPAAPKNKPPPSLKKTTFSATNQKEGTEDDDLCLQIAEKVAVEAQKITPQKSHVQVQWSKYTPYLVIGNHLTLDPPNVHYAFEKGVMLAFHLGTGASGRRTGQ